MKRTSPVIVAIYHKNPKVKVPDVLTGFCRAPKFCDGHTDKHCQFLTQLKLRITNKSKICRSPKAEVISIYLV